MFLCDKSLKQRGKGTVGDGNIHRESSLLVGLRSRDEHAYEQFVQRYRSRVFAVTQRLLRNEDDAQDAVQDTFLSAFRAIDSFEGQAQFSTWLHRIASNAALMKLRTQRRKREEPLETCPSLDSRYSTRAANATSLVNMVPDGKESVDAILQRQEIRALVHACIADLPAAYRSVVMLRDIEELDTAETARRLGASPTAVKLRLHRARKALRTLLTARRSEVSL